MHTLRAHRQFVFMIAGPSGVGKSTVASIIARRLKIEVFSTDGIHLLPRFRRHIAPYKRSDSTKLFPYWLRQQFYRTLTNLGAGELREGRSVVLDATFNQLWTRRYAQRLAKKFTARLVPIEVRLAGVRTKTIERRLVRRYQRNAGAAPPHIHWLYRKNFAPFRGRHFVIHNSGSLTALKKKVHRMLTILRLAGRG